MPLTITELDQWDATITSVDDGEAASGTNFLAAPQGLANRSKWMKARVESLNNQTDRQVPIIGGLEAGSGTRHWFLDGNGFWQQQLVSGTGPLIIPLALPRGVTLTAVKFYLDGGSGSTHSALPLSMPNGTVYNTLPSGTSGRNTIAGPTSDAAANVAAYEVTHTIALSFSELILPGGAYFAALEGEFGTNAIDGALLLRGVSVSWTV